VIVIGVIGPIAAGKGLVASELARLGAAVIRADDVSREVTAPGSATLEAVLQEFGQEYRRRDGGLDRGRMARLIFTEPAARLRLERIMHPPMVQAIRNRLRDLRQSSAPPPAAVVEAANLIEMGARDLVDVLVRVTAPENVRLSRLMERDNLDETQARWRMKTHQELGLDNHPADIIIDNSGSISELREQVARLWTQLTHDNSRQK